MSKFCTQCGNKLELEALFCPNCGTKVDAASVQPRPTRPTNQTRPTRPTARPSPSTEKKSGSTALLLCICLGMFGAHRFYVGRKSTGILMLCSGGMLGVWVIFDLMTIAKNKFEDRDGNTLEVIHNITPLKEGLIIAGSLMLWVALFFAAIAIFLDYSTSGLLPVVEGQLAALRKGQIEQAYNYTASSYQKNHNIDSFKNFVYTYPILLNNESSYLPNRQIAGSSGYARGYLVGKDGGKTSIIYQLSKEDGQWKIVDINIAIPSPPQPAH